MNEIYNNSYSTKIVSTHTNERITETNFIHVNIINWSKDINIYGRFYDKKNGSLNKTEEFLHLNKVFQVWNEFMKMFGNGPWTTNYEMNVNANITAIYFTSKEFLMKIQSCNFPKSYGTCSWQAKPRDKIFPRIENAMIVVGLESKSERKIAGERKDQFRLLNTQRTIFCDAWMSACLWYCGCCVHVDAFYCLRH